MDKNVINRWINEYTCDINLNNIEWVVMNCYDLQEFYNNNYFDYSVYSCVSDEPIENKPLGMHYLPFSKESVDMKYLLGLCKNSIEKKTIIACISYVENYILFNNQSVPLTYLCTCEINKYFRNKGLSKIMFDEFAKVIKPNQHFISTPESLYGGFCNVFKNLKSSLIRSGFEKSITLKDENTDLFCEEYRDLICSENVQLKMK